LNCQDEKNLKKSPYKGIHENPRTRSGFTVPFQLLTPNHLRCLVSNDNLTPNVQRFVAQYIQSLEQLEVLALLFGEPSKEWTAQEVYGRIQSSAISIANQLEILRTQGFLEMKPGAPPRYRYKPSQEEIHVALLETIQTYQLRRVKVIEQIFKNDAGPIKGFADAFKFRKS